MVNYQKCGVNGNTVDYGYSNASCDATNGLPVDEYLFYTFDTIVNTLVKSYKNKELAGGASKEVTKYECTKI